MVMATMSFAAVSMDEPRRFRQIRLLRHLHREYEDARFDTPKFLLNDFICSISPLNGKYVQQNLIFVAFCFFS